MIRPTARSAQLFRSSRGKFSSFKVSSSARGSAPRARGKGGLPVSRPVGFVEEAPPLPPSPPCSLAYGHTMLYLPDLVRSPRSYSVGPGQYWDDRPLWNTGCCRLWFSPRDRVYRPGGIDITSGPVGGRLYLFLAGWQALAGDAFVLSVIAHGCRVSFGPDFPGVLRERTVPPRSIEAHFSVLSEIDTLLLNKK